MKIHTGHNRANHMNLRRRKQIHLKYEHTSTHAHIIIVIDMHTIFMTKFFNASDSRLEETAKLIGCAGIFVARCPSMPV
jgi:hypothetical protein